MCKFWLRLCLALITIVFVLGTSAFADDVLQSRHESFTEDECKAEVNKLIDQLLSDFAQEGNRGLANMEYLFVRLNALSSKKLASDVTTPTQIRALLWGQLYLSPEAASGGLYQLIAEKLPDQFDSDSSDPLGDTYPAIAAVNEKGLLALACVMRAASRVSCDDRDSRQTSILATVVTQQLGKDGAVVRVVCSPKLDPGVTRVYCLVSRQGDSQDEGQEAYAGADH